MIREAPTVVGGAATVVYVRIGEGHRPTGGCRHSVGGRELGPVAGLAIGQYARDSGYYLFYCDADWNTLTDTYHDTLDDAKDQAEFEYEGVGASWKALP